MVSVKLQPHMEKLASVKDLSNFLLKKKSNNDKQTTVTKIRSIDN